MASEKLTDAYIRSVPSAPLGKQILIYDRVMPGFGLRISQTTRSFFLERRFGGKNRRITIGTYPTISLTDARKAAQQRAGELALGIDRKANEANARAKGQTLEGAYREFKSARKLAPRTVEDYDDLLSRLASDWMNRPWTSITEQMVLARHAQVRKQNGGATANHLMRVLSSVLRFTLKVSRKADGSALIARAPTDILSDVSAWFPERPRETVIKPSQFGAWWAAVDALESRTGSDFLKLLALTGLRSGEAKSLRWRDVDLQGRYLTVPQTKNGRPHTIPLSRYVGELLETRWGFCKGEFVFPGSGTCGHLVEVKKVVKRVIAASNVGFTCHDLRRTFCTALDAVDTPQYAMKRLMNHSTASDVTAKHYLAHDIERLRRPMEQVNNYLLRNAGVLPASHVVQLTAQLEAVALGGNNVAHKEAAAM